MAKEGLAGHPLRDLARPVGAHQDDGAEGRLTRADVKRAVGPVEIEPIEGEGLDDPAGHLEAAAPRDPDIGGLPAAFFAGWLLKVAPRKPLMIAVGLLICGIASWELSKALTTITDQP